MDKYIKQEDAVKALWKALYDYEDKTEKQFQESEDLELKDWYSHRIFVQRMSGEDLQAIINLPSADVVEIKKEGEWDMFDLISSAYYGKGMYFKQDNGTVYSRHSGEYMTVDEAIREFISLIDEDVICVPSVTTVWGDGEAPTYVLQKKGKWMHKEITADFHVVGQCSVCKERRRIDNFCPNCGTDMKEES